MTRFIRNLLFGIGIACLIIGGLVAIVWLSSGPKPPPRPPVEAGVAVLVAARAIPAGGVLSQGDLQWFNVHATKAPQGSFSHGATAEQELVGAVARRAIGRGEILTATTVLMPGQRDFLAATLARGYRAVTLPVDASQSASGLLQPGDRVDVILVRSVNQAARGDVMTGETILRDARVMAVGRALGEGRKADQAAASAVAASSSDATPKTITLEARSADAERLFAAAQQGRLELALRPLGEPLGANGSVPTPAVAASGAGGERRPARPARKPGPSVDGPVQIIRGSQGGVQ